MYQFNFLGEFMKKIILGFLALFVLAAGPALAKDSKKSECTCTEHCQKECAEKKSENCNCETCGCKDGTCSHEKCKRKKS